MSFSRFKKSTSANIVYLGANEAIGPSAIGLPANNNKFLKNVNNTLTYVGLPVPDADTQTSEKNNYALVYDFPTKTYVLRKLKLPYYAEFDTLVKYIFMPNTATTTFASGLTQLRNKGVTGSTYDIGGNASTLITNGNSFTLDNGIGLKILPNNPAFFQCNNSFTPRTANHAFVFAIKYDFNLPTKPQGPYVFYRTLPGFNQSNNSTLQCNQNYNTSTNLVNVGVDASPSQLNTPSETIANLSYQIYSIINLGGVLYVYRNGLLLAQATTQQNFTHSNFMTLLQGNVLGASAFNTYGTVYAIALMENITSVLDVQRVESDIKWNSISSVPWTLDSSHPFYSQAPFL